MKKLSLLILLLSLLCCAVLFTACDASELCKDGHTPVTDEAVAATCTDFGLTEGAHCAVCNTVITAQKKVEPKGHTKGSWVIQIEPTCTEDGARYMECKDCQAVMSTEKIFSNGGHEYKSAADYEDPAILTVDQNGWATVKTASCTQEGTKIRECKICDEKQSTVIPVTHSPKATWTVSFTATCTTDGFKYKSCKYCNTVVQTQTTPALGHSFTGDDTVLRAPSCLQYGLSTNHCTTCNEDVEKILPALGHDESAVIIDFFPTCTTNGSQHTECNTCHEILSTKIIPLKEHEPENLDWVVALEASCTQEGLRVFICAYCGTSQKQSIPQKPHVESDWIVDVPATCQLSGIQHKSCLNCQTVTQSAQIPALSHTADTSWTAVTLPTATTAGVSKRLCTACGTALQTTTSSLKQEIVVVDQQKGGIDLSTYSIVCADSYMQGSKLYSYITNVFRPTMTSAAGKTVKVVAESKAPNTYSDMQILIGITSRRESTHALSCLQGRGFTVRIDGNKIVILGSDELLTIAAAQHFVDNYLNNGKIINLPEDSTASALPVISLATLYGSPYVFVSDADLDTDPLHMYVGDSYNNQGYTGDGRDYPVYVFEYLLTRISAISGLALSDFTTLPDTNTTYQNGYELLFGTVDRAQSLAFRAKLDANQYGFRITGNKIILAAHIDAALEPLVEKFLAFYADILENYGGVLPQNYEEVYTLSGTINGSILGSFEVPNWKLDFPRPENAVIEMAENNNDDSIQLIYTGEGVGVNGYLAYCASLEAANYTLIAENNNVGGTNNYFRFYRNTAKNHVLYVAFNAFSAQKEYAALYEKETVQNGNFIHYSAVNGDFDKNGKVDDYEITQYPMRTYKQCIRIVSAPSDKAYLPDAKLLTQQSYTKITNSSITNIRLHNSVGMSYILQLEDGSFVIVDGGGDYNNEDCDEQILYATLTELYKKAYGTAPTEQKPIHIKAWLVTHSHGDHYGTFTSFLKTYSATKLIKMDYLIGNFPELSTLYPVSGDTTTMGSGRIPTLQGYMTSAGLTAFKYVKVHTGMTLYFANLQMEILMTTEDHAPFRITNSNDTNTVTKWTIRATSAASGSISAATVNSAQGTTWTMLGDSCIYASRWMCAMWGGTYNTATQLFDSSYLKSDMVQLAHHGNIGCEISLYKTIQPKVVWFPHYSSAYNSYTQNGSTNWTRTVDSYVVNTLPSVKYIVVAGILGDSYTDSITISFNSSGIYFPTYSTSATPAWGIKYNKSNGTYTTENIKYNAKSYGSRVYRSPVINKG